MIRRRDYGRFKWALLDAAGGIQHQGVAYGIARIHFPEKADREIVQLVRDCMLELWDDGLVVFFHSSFDGGFTADLDEVEPLTRAQLVRALEEGVTVQPEADEFVFFIET